MSASRGVRSYACLTKPGDTSTVHVCMHAGQVGEAFLASTYDLEAKCLAKSQALIQSDGQLSEQLKKLPSQFGA